MVWRFSEPLEFAGMKKGSVDVWSGHSIQRDPVKVVAPVRKRLQEET
jgi:hypothetical protein